MKKIVAVWGSSGSGKTTFATSIASLLYGSGKEENRVAIVYADQNTPAVSYLFPKCKKDGLRSLGVPLSKPVIDKKDVLKNTVTVPGKRNLGILGFIDGENVYSYPSFSEERIKQFTELLGEIVDYVIFDCPCDANNLFTVFALDHADIIFNVVNPDLKSITWSSSAYPLLSRHIIEKKTVTVVNNIRDDVNLPHDDCFKLSGSPIIVIPYSGIINRKWHEGKLLSGKSDKNYEKSIFEGVRFVTGNDGTVRNPIEFIYDIESGQDDTDDEIYSEAI